MRGFWCFFWGRLKEGELVSVVKMTKKNVEKGSLEWLETNTFFVNHKKENLYYARQSPNV